jgi:hypothetical protein
MFEAVIIVTIGAGLWVVAVREAMFKNENRRE